MREAGNMKMEPQLPHLWNPHKIKNNHSRRTDGVMRSADLPTTPFFREFWADKASSMKNTSLLLTVS